MRLRHGTSAKNRMIRFALDFGNSRVKCYAQGPQFLGAFAYSSHDWDEEILRIMKEHAQGEDCIIGISSVNPSMDQQFTELLDEQHCTSIRTKSLLQCSSNINFSLVSGMGEDRMHGLFGAMHIVNPPLITIDCGTAITYNVLDEHGTCLGGAILPGFTTMYKTLGMQTAGLPQLAPQSTLSIIGASTSEAMHAGISSAISGAIHQCLQAFPKHAILIFGGDAESIMAIINDECHERLQYAPDCIARGIFAALDLSV